MPSIVWVPAPSLGEEGSGQMHIYSSCKRNAIILLFTIVRPRTKSSELEWGCNRFTIIIIQPFLLPFEQHGVLPVSVSWPCGLSYNSWSHANHGLPVSLNSLHCSKNYLNCEDHMFIGMIPHCTEGSKKFSCSFILS